MVFDSLILPPCISPLSSKRTAAAWSYRSGPNIPWLAAPLPATINHHHQNQLILLQEDPLVVVWPSVQSLVSDLMKSGGKSPLTIQATTSAELAAGSSDPLAPVVTWLLYLLLAFSATGTNISFCLLSIPGYYLTRHQF